MEKFRDVYDRWEQRQLSQAEAAEILGKSERQFRRYIDRYEAIAMTRRGLRQAPLESYKCQRIRYLRYCIRTGNATTAEK